MQAATVAEINAGAQDCAGSEIVTVYHKVPGTFAIYRTQERVVVQYADDATLASDQRRALINLNPLRGQINGIIDGWRTSRQVEGRTRAKAFDRRVADALAAALQGDPAQGEALLAEVKADVLKERTSPARISYMGWATASAAVIVAISCILTSSAYRNIYAFGPGVSVLLQATALGAVGALFSTGIAMRRRAILTDLQWRENRMDAALRIFIGAIAGALLVALLQSQLLSFQLGLPGAKGDAAHGPLALAIAAFLGGFSERLIPDLLEQSTLVPGARGSSNPIAGATPGPGNATPGAVTASEHNPLGRASEEGAAGTRVEQRETPNADDEVDGCVSEAEVPDEEVTDDSQLPAAAGGVEEVEAVLRDAAPGRPSEQAA